MTTVRTTGGGDTIRVMSKTSQVKGKEGANSEEKKLVALKVHSNI
jgi:hypothetical protein